MRSPVVALALAAVAIGASRAQAQRPTQPPAAPSRPAPSSRAGGDTIRVRGDTATARDTAGKANFAPPDSVMQRLLGLPNYDVTRYEGKSITFDAPTGGIRVLERGTILRDSSIVKGDTIKYGGTGSAVEVNSRKGGTNVFVTPGQAPIFSTGRAEYDIERHSARVRDVTTSVAQNGQTLYITGQTVKAVLPSRADSAARREEGEAKAGSDAVFYLRDGTVTACDDSIPDYYFKAGEIKRTGTFVVARPAVLYIGDVPVMWLPFMFQDVRGGRHSGILAPNIGVSDIVRNSPSYRREIDGLGYYWSVSDYFDAQASVDWRSSAGQTEFGDIGFVRYNGEFQYKWLERYVSGNAAFSQTFRGPDRNLTLSILHNEAFTRNSSLQVVANYVTDTRVQQQTTINPVTMTSTIYSSASYRQKVGPLDLSLGGTRRQYPGRTQVDQTLPNLSLSTSAIDLASWLSWTPNVSYTSTQQTGLDQASSVGRFLVPAKTAAGLDTLVSDSSRHHAAAYASTLGFDTPLQIFGYNLGNRFTINSTRNDFPELQNVTDVNTGVVRQQVYPQTYSTAVDWTPAFTLPALGRNNYNLTAGMSYSNVEGGAFWIRNERTGGRWVHQKKRPTFSLSAGPTLYGLFGGFGPFTRIRHSISPTIGYTYAPGAAVSDDYLIAVGHTKYSAITGDASGYLGSLPVSAINFGLSTNVEAKRRSPNDSNPEAGDKIKLLSLGLGSVSYDFERARATHKAIRGLTTESLSPTLSSDLLPGLDLNLSYSLFEGSTVSDSARFKPFRTAMSAQFTFSNTANPFAVLTRLFGRAAPSTAPPPTPVGNEQPDDRFARQTAAQQVAGRSAQRAGFIPPRTEGWQASFRFSQSTPRPVVGNNVVAFDPTLQCAFLNFPGTRIAYDQCVANAKANPQVNTSAITSGVIGAPVYSVPNTTSLSSDLRFNLTEHWAASVTNQYDFEQKQFSQQIVTLQRDLHDWRASFNFTQAPNGAFSFFFNIALKAEPELKFDYHKATYRGSNY